LFAGEGVIVEDLLKDFPRLHERATDAAQNLLDAVAAT
jgi:hypothetical protein